jgi:DNA adenine methylase
MASIRVATLSKKRALGNPAPRGRALGDRAWGDRTPGDPAAGHPNSEPVGQDGARLAPFLKWAGGKRSLLPRLLPLVPRSIDTYYEPFVGGGALFFELARLGRFRKAKLADRNEELIQCYAAIKRNHEQVVRELETHSYDRDAFYAVREQDPAKLTDSKRAARTIYLNQCGFNGLYRVNQSGRFNVPFGNHRNPSFVRPDLLKSVAAALQNAELIAGDFEEVVAGVTPADFVYFDPPYVPLSATSNFTAYARDGFNAEDQIRLATLLRRLGKNRVPALLSNSDCPVTRDLYRGLRPKAVDARRAINSNAAKRGPVSELIVRSFSYPC